jgi:hypothetical protein
MTFVLSVESSVSFARERSPGRSMGIRRSRSVEYSSSLVRVSAE